MAVAERIASGRAIRNAATIRRRIFVLLRRPPAPERRPTPSRSARSPDVGVSVAGGAYLRLNSRPSRAHRGKDRGGSHRRLVVRVEEPLGVIPELEQTAASAEPIDRAVVLELEVRVRGVD